MPTTTKGTTPVATEIPVWLALPVVSRTNQGMAMRLKVLPNWEIAFADNSPNKGRWLLLSRMLRNRLPPGSHHTVRGESIESFGEPRDWTRLLRLAVERIGRATDSARNAKWARLLCLAHLVGRLLRGDQPAGVPISSGVASSTKSGVEAVSGVLAASAGADTATRASEPSSLRPMAITS